MPYVSASKDVFFHHALNKQIIACYNKDVNCVSNGDKSNDNDALITCIVCVRESWLNLISCFGMV